MKPALSSTQSTAVVAACDNKNAPTTPSATIATNGDPMKNNKKQQNHKKTAAETRKRRPVPRPVHADGARLRDGHVAARGPTGVRAPNKTHGLSTNWRL